MKRYHNINGQLVPADEASLKVNDLAILRGLGIFDYFLVMDSVPLFIEDYLERFYNSAKKLHLNIPCERSQLKERIYELVKANEVPNAAIRLVLTGGYTSDSYTPVSPNLLVLHHDFKRPSKEVYDKGIKLMRYAYRRDFPEVKSINYAMGIKLLPQLRAIGALEPLYHHDGLIQEAVRSNFYLLKDEHTLVTSDRDILFGITRKQVLKACEEHFNIEIRPVALKEIEEAQEAFVTGSNKGVMAVNSVDNHRYLDGKTGPIVKRIMQLFDEHCRSYVDQQKALSL